MRQFALLLALLGCSSTDTGSRPDASVDAGVRAECVSPPTWTEPDVTRSATTVHMSWDDWVVCTEFNEATFEYESCWNFDFGRFDDCGEPPIAGGCPIKYGNPSIGVTIDLADWDKFRAYVDEELT